MQALRADALHAVLYRHTSAISHVSDVGLSTSTLSQITVSSFGRLPLDLRVSRRRPTSRGNYCGCSRTGTPVITLGRRLHNVSTDREHPRKIESSYEYDVNEANAVLMKGL